MTLSAGTHLGHYEILELIGRGGMGEVFRARDTKLKRDVAIKVLPEAFASDEQRMKRFAREAIEPGTPSVLFEGSYLSGGSRNYDVAADGQRFLMIKEETSSEESAPNEIHVVLNWFEELR